MKKTLSRKQVLCIVMAVLVLCGIGVTVGIILHVTTDSGHSHQFGEWMVQKAPSCEAAGRRTRS